MSDNALGVALGVGGILLGIAALVKLCEIIQENQTLKQRVQIVENGLSGQGRGLLQLRTTQENYFPGLVARFEPIERDLRNVRERLRVVETFRITTPLPPGHGFSLS